VRDEAPVEKTLDEQAIVSLSLCLPRPGVFYADITHLLVLATPVEIVLLGACLSQDGARLALQDLPHYSCPSNGVLVTAAACTSPAAGGRVLLGGADGGLHELRYSAETSWRARRCALVSHCGLGGLLPSPLRRLLWAQPLPVRQLVLDETRGAAYARLDGGVIAVYDIAAGGGRWVAELRRLDAALRRENVRGGGGGGRAPARAPPRAPPPADSPVIAIQLVRESAEATLQAVCGDGRRIFLSAYARGSSAPLAAAAPSASHALRPSCLRPVAARDAPPHSASAAAAQAASPGTPPFALAVPPPLQAEAALCCPGLLVLVERPEAAPPATPAAPAARLLLAAADAGGGGFAASGAPLCLLEYVESAQLPGLVAAESGALAELPPPPAAAPLAPLYPGGAAAGALASQHAAPPRRLAALTSDGVLLLQQQRPVDVLADILGGPAARPLLEDFFRHFGAVEAAAMCCQLAAGGGGGAAAAARRALDDARLCGEPRMSDQDAPPATAAAGPAQLNMGLSVLALEPVFSAAHAGLALYARRLLRPAWRRALLAPAGPQPDAPLQLAAPAGALAELEARLRQLASLAGERLGDKAGRAPAAAAAAAQLESRQQEAAAKRRRLEDAAAAEREHGLALRAALRRAADALALLRFAHARGLGAVGARLPAGPARDALFGRRATLRALSTGAEAGAMGEALLAALRAQAAAEGGEAASEALRRQLADPRCGARSFFSPAAAALFESRTLLETRGRAGAERAVEILRAAACGAHFFAPRGAEAAPPATDALRPAFWDFCRALARVAAWPPLLQLCLAVSAAAEEACALEAAAGWPPAPEPLRCARAAAPLLPVCDALRALALAAGGGGEAGGARAEAAWAASADESGCGAAALAALAAPPAPAPAPAAAAALRELLGCAAGGGAAAAAPAAARRLAPLLFASLVAAADALPAGSAAEECLLGPPQDAPPGTAVVPPSAGLDAWLVSEGRLEAAAARGPLTGAQARLLALAAERAARQRRYAGAARLLRALALRADCGGEAAEPGLEERAALLTRAELWAQAAVAGGADCLQPDEAGHISSERAVLGFQARLAAAAGGGERGRLLQRAPLSLDALFNDVAVPLGRHAEALEMLAFSRAPEAAAAAPARALWDGLLAAAAEAAGEAAASRLAAAAAAAAATGGAVAESPAALPLPHVALRLEQVAAGLWPPAAAGGGCDNAPVAAALLAAGRGGAEAGARAVAGLLEASAGGGELGHPALRAGLLRTQLRLGRAWAAEAGAALAAPPPPPPGLGWAGGALGARAGDEARGRLGEAMEQAALCARAWGEEALARELASVTEL